MVSCLMGDSTALASAIVRCCPRNFLQSVVNKIEIDNGKVMSILFKNGIQHKFIYVE